MATTRAVEMALAGIGIAVGAWCSLLLVAWAVYFSSLSPLSQFHGWSSVVSVGNRTIVAHDAGEAADTRQVIRYLRQHGTDRQRAFIAPQTLRFAMYNPTDLYYLLGLQPASPYLEMNPGLETRPDVQRQIIAGLHDATWVILWKGGYWEEPNASLRPGSALLARYIQVHYRLVMQNATYQVLSLRT